MTWKNPILHLGASVITTALMTGLLGDAGRLRATENHLHPETQQRLTVNVEEIGNAGTNVSAHTAGWSSLGDHFMHTLRIGDSPKR